MNLLRCVKGMHDVLPDDMPYWHFLEATYRELVERYGYQEIRTPVLEPLELFVRGIGEATDIVEKEMYAFEDKGGANLALRPEGTASVIRSYLQHNLASLAPINKLYYVGPMFRRERPAKGRFRQFYQAGAELIGAAEPSADAEIIDMAVKFVKALGIENVRVQLNSLGDGDTRPRYREALVDYFGKSSKTLCEDCRRRLDTNPLRVLDCKVTVCKEVAEDAPSVLEFLSDDARDHFESLKQLLDADGTAYQVVPSMVRGLDYYTRTIFEIQGDSDTLGAQATMVGGGRYNDLVEEFGGKSTSTIGFAFGIERLLMMLDARLIPANRPTVFVAGIEESGKRHARLVARTVRDAGYKVEIAYRDASLRSQLKRADKCGATITLIAGEDEAARGIVTWRDMGTGEQREVAMADLTTRIGALK